MSPVARTLEFLMCGSPTDAFWSQAAMFRLALDGLGEPYSSARQVLCVGAPGEGRIPGRWEPWFERIEVQWTDASEFPGLGYGAQTHLMYRAPDSSADLSIICDADTLLIKRLPEEFLEESVRSPAVSGVIAHVPPPLIPYPDSEAEAPADHEQLWARLASTTLGRPIATPYGYTLLRGTERAGERCPFYINHGFIAAPPGLMAGLSVQIEEIIDRVRSVLDNDFAYQLAIPYALERGSIPHRTLPMRFNFPNDPRFDQRYPVELDNILLVHYLRTRLFDRHTLFTDEAQFARFMTAPLEGSNHAFRDAVRRLSGGRYPFREGL